MVGAVVDRDPHALDRVARDRSALHRVAHALLHRRDEGGRDHAALDAVDELELALALRHRLDLDVAVAELPAPARLLLVAPVRLGARADRLLVGDLRRLEVDLAAEARAQPVDDDLDVDLREPGDDLLARLRVAVQVDRRVLLLQAAQGGEHLVLVALRDDVERHHGRRERDRRHLDRLVAVGEPVARAGLLELGDRADVARAEGVRVPEVLALRHEELADALLGVDAGVEHVGVVVQHALVDPEQVDASRERIRAGLEDVGERRGVLRRLERRRPHVERPVLDGRREVVDEGVEQPVRSEMRGGDPAGDREDAPGVRPVLEGLDDLVVGDLLPLQVALHERLGVLGDLVHELLAVLLGELGDGVGDRDLGAVVPAGGRRL